MNPKIIKLLTFWIPVKKLRRKARNSINKRVKSYKLRQIKKKYHDKILELQNKENINIAFFVISNIGYISSVLEPIYQRFSKDKKYNATIVITPYTYFSCDYTKETCAKTETYLKHNNIKYINGYDGKNNRFVDVKNALKPDIVFFMMPYDYLSPKEFNIDNYLDSLTCYVPYSYMLANNMQGVLNTRLTNIVWKIFGDSFFHKELLKQYADNKGRNIADYQGYTKTEPFELSVINDEWKIKDENILKIIWAPHHSMECYANFPRFCDFFIELAQKYQDKIQIAFRPHPVLKEILIKHPEWGEEKTESYYKKWDEMPNAFYHSEEYFDLFKTSDALILDSVSFMAEYMFTGKPLLFLNTEEPFGFNPFGEMVNENCYNGNSKDDIKSFIENQVINNIDPMKKGRVEFVKQYLAPPNNKSASENIYQYMEKCIFNREDDKEKLLSELREKTKIKAMFFVINKAIWAHEYVYQRMLKDNLFEPVIVVVPMVSYGKDHMIESNQEVYDFYKSKGYENILKAYDRDTDEIIDFKEIHDPDIVFFVHPYESTSKEYLITNFSDKLTYYSPYSFSIANLQEMHYNQPLHNLVHKHFVETEINLKIAKKYSDIKAKNVVVTGLPQADIFLSKDYIPTNCWKDTKNRKKIILAPHHSIEDNNKKLGYSNFLKYHDEYLNIADKYRDHIYIAFKPHPSLKYKLYKSPDWGKARTDEYFEKYSLMENTQLETSNYIDLFLTSDALILDSISFILEYMYTGNPLFFMEKNKYVRNKFNKIGKKVYKTIYKGQTVESIYEFIENVVIGQDDTMKEKRAKFLKDYLIPKNGKSASENIYQYIIDELRGKN